MAGDPARATIFVSIASYCDPLLWWTVRNAWEQSSNPERLVFGILDQSLSGDSANTIDRPWSGRLRYSHVLPKDSQGVCWARSLVFQMYEAEDYLLQIDSHTHFKKGWDSTLIKTLERISTETGREKVIISTRPFGFDLDPKLGPVTKEYTTKALVLKPRQGVGFDQDHPILPFDSFVSDQERPVKGFQVAAGFIFTRGHFAKDVPYDPQLYFHGEEQNLFIRAFTRGWDVWHPDIPPLFHQYKNHNNQKHSMHWDPVFDLERPVSWFALEKASRKRMRELLFDRTLTGEFGLGSSRTLEDFRDVSGIDYERRRIIT
jgi:hypothetical protein